MYVNFIKIAIRNLQKKPFYSTINLLGLTAGMLCFMLIVGYVSYELSYDRFIPNSENIYKINVLRKYTDRQTQFDTTPQSLAEVLLSEVPEIQNTGRLTIPGGEDFPSQVTYRDKEGNEISSDEAGFGLVDNNFMNIFQLPLKKGDLKTVLKNPNTLIIDETTSKKYFGDKNPVGEQLKVDSLTFTVTGIMYDLPDNSHFKFNMLASWESLSYLRLVSFIGFTTHTYLSIPDGFDPEDLNTPLNKIVDQHIAPAIEQRLGMSWESYTQAGNGYTLAALPLGKLHLAGEPVMYRMKPGTSATLLYTLIFIAILILVIAGVNYTNMATARSTDRSKEIGVRKSLGSQKSSITKQFLVESIVISTFSLALAYASLYFVLPHFQHLIDRPVGAEQFSGYLLWLMIVISILVGVLAGIYPALQLASINPAVSLKGKFKSSSKGIFLRNSLVSFQLVISIMLIITTLVVQKQLRFIENNDMGFANENIITLERIFLMSDPQAKTLADRIKTLPGVTGVGISNTIPGRNFGYTSFTTPANSEPVSTRSMSADDEFMQILDFKLIDGRLFSPDFNDSTAVILNESAVKLAGITDPIGKIISISPENTNKTKEINLTIVGVVKDFNIASLHDKIVPTIITSFEGPVKGAEFIVVKTESPDKAGVLSNIESKWKESVPHLLMKSSYFDDEHLRFYAEENAQGRILSIFAIVAIIISGFGIYGLISFIADAMKKEIGVRKLLGAKTVQIIMIIVKDFSKLTLIAAIIATPLAWYFVDLWLQQFAYRTTISFAIILSAVCLTYLVVILTLGYQTIMAASMRPISVIKE